MSLFRTSCSKDCRSWLRPVPELSRTHGEGRSSYPVTGSRTAVLVCCLLGLLIGAQSAHSAQHWDSSSVRVPVGSKVTDQGPLELVLDSTGNAVIELPTLGLHLDSLNRFAVSASSSADEVEISLAWWIVEGIELATVPLVRSGQGTYHAQLATNSDWPETIGAIALRVTGPPTTRVVLDDIRLDGSFLLNITGPFADRLRPQPLGHDSINVTSLQSDSTQRLSLIGVLSMIFLSGGLYMVFFGPGRLTRGAAPMFLLLLIWLFADSLWLYQLQYRSLNSVSLFGGLSTRDKLLASSDRRFVELADAVAPLVPDGSRLFVATQSDFGGMRAAYYLYPRNLYWKRGGPELPPAERLRSTDRILLIAPSELKLLGSGDELIKPDGEILPVKILWSDNSALLVEVLK